MLYTALKWAALLGGLVDGIRAYRRRGPALMTMSEAAQILKEVWTDEALLRQLEGDALLFGESFAKVTWDRQGSVSHGQVAVIPVKAGEPIFYNPPPTPVWRDVPEIPEELFDVLHDRRRRGR